MPFFERLAELERGHASFAIATVVARQSPVSSHLGDRALIFPDGRMEGFVGGSCSRDIVRRQALNAIRRRTPLLLQIRPDDDARAAAPSPEAGRVPATERVIVPMSCSSEGAVDVYIEPRVPLRRLLVAGLTPVADALARLAASLDYDIVRVVTDDESRDLGQPAGTRIVALAALPAFLLDLAPSERGHLVAVVASQGHYDELVLEALGPHDVAFVGLLASRRRAATVFGVLAQQGLAADRLARIRNPVGLDIGARSPGEVAISILAEIIVHAPLGTASGSNEAAPVANGAGSDTSVRGPSAAAQTANPGTAVDPVCGMDVATERAPYVLERDGRQYFFCCAGCRAAFAARPASDLIAPRS